MLHILNVCNLRYPARNAHAPYYILICGLSGPAIFFHIITYTEGLSGGGELLNTKCVLIFSTAFAWNNSHSKKNWARYYHKRTHLHVKYPSFFSNFNKIWASSTDFDKYWNIKFHVGAKKFHANGKTDMTKLIVTFRNSARAFTRGPRVEGFQSVLF
jgi:hypothetical protein